MRDSTEAVVDNYAKASANMIFRGAMTTGPAIINMEIGVLPDLETRKAVALNG